MGNGCPVCKWSGDVAQTHDYSYRYYTHVIVKNGEVFKGRTCSERTKPKRGLFARLVGWSRGS